MVLNYMNTDTFVDKYEFFFDSDKLKHKSSHDGSRLKNDKFRRGCRLQDRLAVQGWSESRQHVIAHRRGGREARLALSGIREHEVFFGHEMGGPAGTGRDGVLMAGGR